MAHVWCGRFYDVAKAVRRDSHHEHVGAGHRLLEVVGCDEPDGSFSSPRYAALVRSVLISSATSRRRDHSVVVARRLATAATVVPHDPEPTTVTRTPIVMLLRIVQTLRPV